jgi:Beta-lactamase
MDRRIWLKSGLLGAAGFVGMGSPVWAQDKWGAERGYPALRDRTLSQDTTLRVGNYSGGFEQQYPHQTIKASGSMSVLEEPKNEDFTYRWGVFGKSPKEYLSQNPVTGLLICRDSRILFEAYRMQRTASMRLTSWSMAKSITSLLLGICLDRKLIASYDDPAEKYVKELQGSLHGQTTLRNLSNMSSGAQIEHVSDNRKIYPAALMGAEPNILRTVQGWNERREEQGKTYNYNELCALTVGLVVRQVSGKSLSQLVQESIWQPMGAQADATWLTDGAQREFNCIGFAAVLRDWARLGILVAHRGQFNGQRIISEDWMNEITRWSPQDSQVRVGTAMRTAGYKAFMWHAKPDGSALWFSGFHGQRVMINMNTRAVVVQTAVSEEGNQMPELMAMMEAAGKA